MRIEPHAVYGNNDCGAESRRNEREMSGGQYNDTMKAVPSRPSAPQQSPHSSRAAAACRWELSRNEGMRGRDSRSRDPGKRRCRKEVNGAKGSIERNETATNRRSGAILFGRRHASESHTKRREENETKRQLTFPIHITLVPLGTTIATPELSLASAVSVNSLASCNSMSFKHARSWTTARRIHVPPPGRLSSLPRNAPERPEQVQQPGDVGDGG